MSLKKNKTVKISNKNSEEKIKPIEKQSQVTTNTTEQNKIIEISNKNFEKKIKHIQKLQQELNKISIKKIRKKCKTFPI